MMNRLRTRGGWLLAVLLASWALLFAYWGAGGTRGLESASGSAAFSPPAWLMWGVALLLLGWMGIVLGAMGVWGGQAVSLFCRVGCYLMSLALLGIASAYLAPGTRWERMIAGPVALLCALCAALLVTHPPRARRLFPW